MDETTRAWIKGLLAQLEADLEAYLVVVNRKIATQQGGIEALKQVLEGPAAAEPSTAVVDGESE